MAFSKIILDGETLMDVTQDTVTPNTLLSGYTATDASGEQITGNISTKTGSDLSVSGDTVTIPAGYYASQQTASVASGTAGTPTATKGTVSNHSVSVTPSVTNSAGYISSGTISGTPVTVSASELVSGSQNINSNNTYDVTNLEEVVVNVQPNNQNKTVNPSQSQQLVTADSGYTGLGTVTVTAMPAGSAGTPTATKGTVSNHSVDVTPSVTNSAGYISSGTLSGTPVTVSASELVSGSQTITSNSTVDVTNLAEVVVSVGSAINNQNKTVNPSLSQQLVTADSGYSGLGTVTVTAMPTGTEGTPVADVTTDQQTQNIIVTPKATNTAGYISGGLRVGEPVTINPGVTSFNGDTGDITYTAPVTSVNGNTGAVTLSIPTKTSDLNNDSGYITDAGVTSFNGNTGAVTYTAPVTSVNGNTGAVTLSIPATPSAYVTAKGTKSSWTYRKWSDNTYECWKSIEFSNISVSTTWGTTYYVEVSAQSLPVTFSSVPQVYVTPKYGDKTIFIGTTNTNATTSKTPKYVFWRPTSATVNVTLDYYVKGTVSS